MAVTSRPQTPGFPLDLELSSGTLPKRSWVKISQVPALSIERLGKAIGHASPEELTRIVEGLNRIVGD